MQGAQARRSRRSRSRTGARGVHPSGGRPVVASAEFRVLRESFRTGAAVTGVLGGSLGHPGGDLNLKKTQHGAHAARFGIGTNATPRGAVRVRSVGPNVRLHFAVAAGTLQTGSPVQKEKRCPRMRTTQHPSM